MKKGFVLVLWLLISVAIVIIFFGIRKYFQNTKQISLDIPKINSTISPSSSPIVTLKPSVKTVVKTNAPTLKTIYKTSVKLYSISPNPAKSGETITLKGSGFGPSNHRVWFYNSLGLVLYSQIGGWNDTQITTNVPNLSPGNFEIEVEKSDGTKSNRLSFNVSSGQPIISSYPQSTKFGSRITILGSNFGMSQGRIEIMYTSENAGNCIINAWNNGQIICDIPASLSHGANEYGFWIVTSDERRSSMVYININ